MTIDERVLEVLEDGQSKDEWEIAQAVYPWSDKNRSKHGAWIRVIVQALWRLQQRGKITCLWQGHGLGIPTARRIWVRRE